MTGYEVEHAGKKYQFEIHSQRGQSPDEIIVMVECSKGSFLGSFFGRARYFAVSSISGPREIEADEAF